MDQTSENLYEVKSLKRQIAQNLSCQVGLNVYFSAKLHMLKFYYLFLKKDVVNKDFALLESDRILLYFSISKNLKDSVRPELKKEFYVKTGLSFFSNTNTLGHWEVHDLLML